MANVNWTDQALHSLDIIYAFIAQDAPFYAEHFIEQLLSAVDHLEAFPLSGRHVPEAERDDIREVIYKDYRIIYWLVSETRVDVISVFHSSRDLYRTENRPWEEH